MNCQRVQDLFPDFQEGTLAPAEAAGLQAHLASCPACQKEWSELQALTLQLDRLAAEPGPAPSPRLRANFYAMLETHRQAEPAPGLLSRVLAWLDGILSHLFPSRPAWQFAFSLALLGAGLLAGLRFARPAADPGTQQQLAALQAKIDGMDRLVTYSLLQQKSTSERLQGVLATLDLKSPDRKVLTDLVGTLALDPSMNVRLSAVEALAPHASDRLVRAGLLSTLPRESAPLVQLAMIELLASVHEHDAAPVLEQLSRNEATDPNVRSAARRALVVLRAPAPAGIGAGPVLPVTGQPVI